VPLIKPLFHQGRRWLAKHWLALQPATQIGVTGSFGKTSTTRAIAQVLSSRFKVRQTDLNLDTLYNVPITALKVWPWHRVVVFELGVDHQGEMTYHLEIVRPKIGVVTGITPVHADQEHFGSLAKIIAEKQKLIKALPPEGLAVLNADDEAVRAMAKQSRARVLFYGRNQKSARLWAEKIQSNFNGLSFILRFKDKAFPMATPLLGSHHVYTCLAAAAVALELGFSLQEIKEALKKLTPLSGRLDLKKGPFGTLLLDDHLRANPASTAAGLQFLKELKVEGRKIAVLGEMGELGEYAVAKHREIGRLAATCNLDYLLCVGVLPKEIYHAALMASRQKQKRRSSQAVPKIIWVADVFEAAARLKKILQKGDVWYLKGSLLKHMERVLLILEGEKVACRLPSCHFYQPCLFCPKLKS